MLAASRSDVQQLHSANLELLAAAKGSESKPRRFHMLAYTGAEVDRWGRMIFDLAGIELPEKLPILRGHDPNRPCALGTELAITEAGLEIGGRMATNEAAQEVVQLSDDFKDEGGFWQASVGLHVQAWEELYDEDQVATVNGREVKGPCLIARRSVLRESSFVPLGADKDTSAVALAAAAKGEGMDPKKLEEARAEGRAAAITGLSAMLGAYPGREALVAACWAEAKGEELRARALLADRLFAQLAAAPGATVQVPASAGPGSTAPAQPVAPVQAAQGADPTVAELGARITRLETVQQLRVESRHPGVGFAGAERQDPAAAADLSHLGEDTDERLEAEWTRLDPGWREAEYQGNKRAFFALARREGLDMARGV